MVDRATEAAVPSHVFFQASPQLLAAERGPGGVNEHRLRTRHLLQQAVGQVLLPRRAGREVNVGHAGQVGVV